MQHIGQAAQDLLQRIQSCCPSCETHGYWITDRQAGLLCSDCGIPTSSYCSQTWSCFKCTYTSIQMRTDRTTEDPKYCQYCNP